MNGSMKKSRVDRRAETQPTLPTGRWRSEPHLQNIPIRTETGRKIREAFVLGVKLNVDFAALEERVAEHLKEDKEESENAQSRRQSPNTQRPR